MSATEAPRSLAAPQVIAGGSPLAAEWAAAIVSLSVELQLQLPGRLTIRFTLAQADRLPGNAPFQLGDEVTVEFPAGDELTGERQTRLADGYLVTEVGIERDRFRTPNLVVVAHDRSWPMTATQTVTTYTNQSSSQIVSTLAGQHGLTAKVTSTRYTHPYLMQADTDFGFVTTLARREGFDWWVDGRELHFAPPPTRPATVTAHAVSDVIELSVRATAVPHEQVTVHGWDPAAKKATAGSSTTPNRPDVEVPGSRAPRAKGEVATSAIRPGSVDEAGTLAAAIAARETRSALQADGTIDGDPEVVPGVTLEIVGDHLAGAYPVTRCEHRYDEDGYTTRFVAGDREPHGLADLLGPSTGATDLASFAGFPAAVPAVVTKIGEGDDLGRVKVKFPYLSDADESHWARVLAAGGGPERGFWFLPEVDDEVLVAFEGGDVRYPVVLGGLYGKVATPADQVVKNGKIPTRSVRSRLGHRLEMYDGDDAGTRHIQLGLGKGGKQADDYKLRLGEDRFDLEVPKGKPIAIKAGATQFTITDAGHVEITGKDVKISGDNITLDAKQTVTIKGTREVSAAQGANKVTLGASGTEVKGAPMTTIKGGPNVSIG